VAAQACTLLDEALEAHPQDYSLQEALQEALKKRAQGSDDAAEKRDTERAAAAPIPTNQQQQGGLSSSYYYAAVPASSRSLPVQPPPRISPSAHGSAHTTAAGGKIRQDLDRKGPDNSYYYAHDRKMDYTVPTVPKKINPDGSLTSWDGK